MLEIKPEEAPKFKHSYMGEFCSLWSEDGDTWDKPSFRVINQSQETVMHVSIAKGTLLYTRLRRLEAFGWVIRYIEYQKDGDLDIYFEKTDPRNYNYYGVNPQLQFKVTANDEKPL